MSEGHSWFSPSAASRIIRCPGSVRECKDIPRQTTQAADDGTLCHTAMELYYRGVEEGPELTAPWMQEAIDFGQEKVDAFISELIVVHGEPELNLEKQVHLVGHDDIFGTVDMLLWFPVTRHLVLIDHKFGMGEVEVENNEQLLCYAAFAVGVDGDESRYPADSVALCINQPRLKKFDVWAFDVSVLMHWKHTVLSGAVFAARQPDAPLVPGEVQCKWCTKGRLGCAAAIDFGYGPIQNLLPSVTPATTQAEIDVLMSYEPRPVAPLIHAHVLNANDISAAELAVLGKQLPAMKLVIDMVETALTERQLAGEVIPGFQLVYKDTRAAWADEKKADGFLQRKKLSLDTRSPRKLVSPAQAKKLIEYHKLPATSRGAFDELLAPKLGEPVYAPLGDKRKPYILPVAEEVTTEETINEIDISSLF